MENVQTKRKFVKTVTMLKMHVCVNALGQANSNAECTKNDKVTWKEMKVLAHWIFCTTFKVCFGGILPNLITLWLLFWCKYGESYTVVSVQLHYFTTKEDGDKKKEKTRKSDKSVKTAQNLIWLRELNDNLSKRKFWKVIQQTCKMLIYFRDLTLLLSKFLHNWNHQYPLYGYLLGDLLTFEMFFSRNDLLSYSNLPQSSEFWHFFQVWYPAVSCKASYLWKWLRT